MQFLLTLRVTSWVFIRQIKGCKISLIAKKAIAKNSNE